MMMNKETIYKMSQTELKEHLQATLSAQYNNVESGDGWLFAHGAFPVCLVAHLDTVHKEQVRELVYTDNGNKLSSPQGIGGDDRNGVIAILEIIKHYNCSVLFLEDEEIGCIGAYKFVKHPISDNLKFNYMIELDRKGKCDAVFYECDNVEFEDFITQDKDWYTDYGSFSDICVVAPKVGCAAVNLSVGYYNQHTKNEYVVLSEMEASIGKVCKLLERTKPEDIFEYVEAVYADSNNWSYENTEHYFCIIFWNNGEEDYAEYYANSDFEALGLFFVDHDTLSYKDVITIEDYGKDVYVM